MKKIKIILIATIIILMITSCKETNISTNNSAEDNKVEDIKVNDNKIDFTSLSSDELESTYNESDKLSNNLDSKITNGLNEFSLDLFKEIQKNESDNIFISPYSINSVLLMLYNGAESNTKNELKTALHLEDVNINELNKYTNNLITSLTRADSEVTIDIGNSMWINNRFKPNSQYVDTIKNNFFSYIYTKDFNNKNTVKDINTWISNATNGMIENVLQETNDNAAMFLINAIYFNARWSNVFDECYTQIEPFYSDKGKSNVSMMNKTSYLSYLKNKEVTGIKLPYGRDRISFYGFVPTDKNTEIDTIISNMDANILNKYFKEFESYPQVNLKLPKFKISYENNDLINNFKDLGIKNIFDHTTSDLSNISEELFVSDFIHNTVIDVNEEGAEAAAVTISDVSDSCAPEEEINDKKEFIADRPFLFVIRDDVSGVILFMGKINNIN